MYRRLGLAQACADLILDSLQQRFGRRSSQLTGREPIGPRVAGMTHAARTHCSFSSRSTSASAARIAMLRAQLDSAAL